MESRQTLWIVSALMVATFLTANLPWQLDDYDQAKQAFTSFEMVKEGHWLYQRTPHERVATKPPLVGWISAGIFEVTRSWDIAWRLPSFAAAIALAILLFRAGSVYGAVGGLIALSAFAFNLLTPRLASLVRTDMPLALIVFLIGAKIWRHIRAESGWSPRDRFVLFALLTTAMLIKGPIVYAFVFPGVLLFVWTYRKTPAEGRRGCGWWPWLGSLAIFLAWVIGGSVFVPNFYDQVVMREFVGRFGETVHRPQPFYFYLPHLLHKFAPWSVLMIVIAIFDFRERTKLDGATPSSFWSRWTLKSMKPETLWLVGWTFGGLLVMSLIPSKRVDRIFPVIPPLCLLLAAQISRTQIRARILQWSAAALLFSILFAGGYSAFKVFRGYRDHRDALVKFGRAAAKEAVEHRWRYEVVDSSDEGLLLYLQKLHFVRPENAIAEWNAGNLNALVAPVNQLASILPNLSRDAYASEVRVSDRRDGGIKYVLITCCGNH